MLDSATNIINHNFSTSLPPINNDHHLELFCLSDEPSSSSPTNQHLYKQVQHQPVMSQHLLLHHFQLQHLQVNQALLLHNRYLYQEVQHQQPAVSQLLLLHHFQLQFKQVNQALLQPTVKKCSTNQ